MTLIIVYCSAYLDVHLVAAENDGDVLADTLEVTVPVGDVLVGDAGGDIEHDDTALALDVVTIAETTELLLAGGIPKTEGDGFAVDHDVGRVVIEYFSWDFVKRKPLEIRV